MNSSYDEQVVAECLKLKQLSNFRSDELIVNGDEECAAHQGPLG